MTARHRGPIGVEQLRPILQPGWPAAVGAAAVGAATMAVLQATATEMIWFTGRCAGLGLAMLLGGLAFGSNRLVGLAGLPLLTAALIGVDPADGLAWGRAMLLGTLWYATAELAWASIERRDGTVRRAAVARSRAQEVAVVILVSMAVGLGIAGLGLLAPARTLLVRTSVFAAILIGLAYAAQRLLASAPTPNRPPDDPRPDDPQPDDPPGG